MGDDMITGAEFGRFRVDFSAWQDRLETRLSEGFAGVHNRLDELNGRTRKNTENLMVLDAKVARLEPIETHVMEIQSKGCAQFEAHRALMSPAEIAEEERPKWPRRRQVAAGGGLVGAGVLLTKLVDIIYQHFASLQHVAK